MRSGPSSTFLEPPDSASYDALADLFLGSSGHEQGASAPAPVPTGSAGTRTQPEPARPPSFEMLVMGHLPVRSNPWAAQYARAVADQGRPVVLLRMIGGEVWVDLFGVRPDERERYHESDLESALIKARSFASHWIVQCDEADPVAALPLKLATSVTLLCAGNEASVLAAFQSLKALAPALESHPKIALRVGVMGAEPSVAASINARLCQSADLFLKRRVEAATSVGRMGPTGGAVVFRGATQHIASTLLELAARAIPALVARAPRPTVHPRAVPAPPPAADDEGARGDPASRPDPSGSTAPSPITSRLAARLPGLAPLAFRCPEAPAVEFAADASKCLHLLLASDGPEALHALAAAEAWATRHADLLRLVVPGLRADGAAMHLFTSTPKRLRGLLDTSVRVHLLAGVEVEGKTGWCCVELN